MNSLLNKLINYGVFFILIFAINSCAHFRITNLEKNKFKKDDFYNLLSQEYLELAKFELYDMHDEIDANLFAFKSSISLNKKIFYPENPNNWKIPLSYEKEALMFFNKIKKLIKNEVYLNHPRHFAKTLAAYDCWIEQIEENWQTDHINACYEKFNKNLNFITSKISDDNKKVISKNNKKEINTSAQSNDIIRNKQENDKEVSVDKMTTFKTLVFFDFDKFTLSSQQLLQLELFINTASKYPDMQIFIEGHTDTMGSKDYNDALSTKRANFIKKHLLEKSLENKINTNSYGENKLLIHTNDEVKEKKNRRAELHLK